jgi:DNA modification methylase
MVEVFREVRRVLRDDGTLWLNLGDSYGSVGGNTHAGFNARYHGTQSAEDKQGKALNGVTERTVVTGLATKNLLGIPWRVAFALQADGWTLRQDIIWHKPNPMPESVTDRCTKAHEYIFLMSKSQKYHYDADAIKEEMIGKPHAPKNKANKNDGHLRNDVGTERMEKVWGESGMANKRSVWTVSTRPFKEAHFATFPPQLIEPCVKAGSKAGDTILDPFSGAGTTGLVAFQHEREFIGIELNPEYAEIATRRIEHERSLTPLLEAIK